MVVARMLKDPPVEGTWAVSTPFANVLVRASRGGVKEIKFVTADAARTAARAQPPADVWPWLEELLVRLEQYLAGEEVSFDEFPVDLSDQTEFRRKVQMVCRKIPYGKTVTYAELAKRAGQPAAVRAAGSAMRHNPVPLLVPCHRVVRSDGSIGGFSALDGVPLKKKLLDLESRE